MIHYNRRNFESNLKNLFLIKNNNMTKVNVIWYWETEVKIKNSETNFETKRIWILSGNWKQEVKKVIDFSVKSIDQILWHSEEKIQRVLNLVEELDEMKKIQRISNTRIFWLFKIAYFKLTDNEIKDLNSRIVSEFWDIYLEYEKLSLTEKILTNLSLENHNNYKVQKIKYYLDIMKRWKFFDKDFILAKIVNEEEKQFFLQLIDK